VATNITPTLFKRGTANLPETRSIQQNYLLAGEIEEDVKKTDANAIIDSLFTILGTFIL